MWQRTILFVAALCLIVPEIISSVEGLALLAGVGGAQLMSKRGTVAAKRPAK